MTEKNKDTIAENERVAPATSQAVNALPDYLSEFDSALGLENITADKMEVPRLVLAQDITDEAKKPHPKYIKGLEPGMFFNALTREILGPGPHLITPLLFKYHRRKFSPRNEGAQTLCVSENGINGGRISPKGCKYCADAKWGFDTSTQKPIKPRCTEMYTYPILFHIDTDHFMPMILTLKSKMVKSAEKFNGLMKMRGGGRAPAFTGIYSLESWYDTSSPAGGFHNMKLDNAGWVDKSLLENVKSLFETFSGRINEITKTENDEDDVIESEVVDSEETPF